MKQRHVICLSLPEPVTLRMFRHNNHIRGRPLAICDLLISYVPESKSGLLLKMKDGICLAWAVRVEDYSQLGARLEAYVEAKATITTFEACKLHASSSSLLKQLPKEIMREIAEALTDMIYIPKIKYWQRVQKCLNGRCRTKDHQSSHYSSYYDEDDSDCCSYESAFEEHQETLEDQIHKLENEDSEKSRFAFCKKVWHTRCSFVASPCSKLIRDTGSGRRFRGSSLLLHPEVVRVVQAILG